MHQNTPRKCIGRLALQQMNVVTWLEVVCTEQHADACTADVCSNAHATPKCPVLQLLRIFSVCYLAAGSPTMIQYYYALQKLFSKSARGPRPHELIKMQNSPGLLSLQR
jgi:hypothetical protein